LLRLTGIVCSGTGSQGDTVKRDAANASPVFRERRGVAGTVRRIDATTGYEWTR
jgi:hypothetical protein